MESNGNEKVVATIDHDEVHVNVSTIQSLPPTSVEYSTSRDEVKVDDNKSHIQEVTQTQPDPKKKPKNFVVTSCVVLMFCNFIFGYLGYHYGVKSNNAWELGDEFVARKRAKTAMIFVILGIAAGVVTYVLVFTLYFTLRDKRYPGVHSGGAS